MAQHHEQGLVIVLIGLVGMFAFSGLLAWSADPPQGLVVNSYNLDAPAGAILVPLPVMCTFQKATGNTLLECNCQERAGFQRANNPLRAEVQGKWCEHGEALCGRLCDKPPTLKDGYVIMGGKAVSVANLVVG